VFDKIWTSVFYVAAIGFMGLLAYLLIKGQDGQFLALMAAIIALLGSRIKDLLKFELSPKGLKTELRSLIDEAKATVAQLHTLAIEQSKIALQTIHAAGRLGGGSTDRNKEKMRQGLIDTLTKIGVVKDKIEEVLSVEQPTVAFDYAYYVTTPLQGRVPLDRRPEWDAFFSHKIRKGIGTEASPDELDRFLSSMGMLDGEVTERLADYRHYLQTHTHRRPEAWLDRNAG
jgi:hypothetical protein